MTNETDDREGLLAAIIKSTNPLVTEIKSHQFLIDETRQMVMDHAETAALGTKEILAGVGEIRDTQIGLSTSIQGITETLKVLSDQNIVSIKESAKHEQQLETFAKHQADSDQKLGKQGERLSAMERRTGDRSTDKALAWYHNTRVQVVLALCVLVFIFGLLTIGGADFSVLKDLFQF